MLTQEALPEWQERRRDAGDFPAESFLIFRQYFIQIRSTVRLSGTGPETFIGGAVSSHDNTFAGTVNGPCRAGVIQPAPPGVPARSGGLTGERTRHEWRT